MNKQLTIGLFGFGVVGEGIYEVLSNTPSLNSIIKKVCIKHPDKKRNADMSLFTTDSQELLEDEEINLIVELIDDADEAFRIVSSAMIKGKAVVSANKKMIAEHFTELLSLQELYNVPFLYEAAVCGSVPIIRNLEEYYDNDMLKGLSGIVNGSTNFILTKIISENLDYQEALSMAQRLGFAESDPSLDVGGFDASNKLSILLAHAYGVIVEPSKLLFKGITQIHRVDSKFAEERNYHIKLTAQARKLSDGKIAAFVLPQFVTPEHQLYNVKSEYNGVVIESVLADKQFLYGKGAGRYPTSSAVLSDISALSYHYRYEYKKLRRNGDVELSESYFLRVYVSFDNWSDVNKWDFEIIEEFHSTQERQYLIGIISANKLKAIDWFDHPDISTIVLPDGIIERQEMLLQTSKKVTLQVAGIT